MTDAFRKGQVGLGLGVNQIAGAAGFLIGPIIGGLLTEFSWRWVFLFNVPIGIFGALWGIWRLHEPVRPLEHQPIDWFGTFSLSVGLFGLLLPFSTRTCANTPERSVGPASAPTARAREPLDQPSRFGLTPTPQTFIVRS